MSTGQGQAGEEWSGGMGWVAGLMGAGGGGGEGGGGGGEGQS